MERVSADLRSASGRRSLDAIRSSRRVSVAANSCHELHDGLLRAAARSRVWFRRCHSRGWPDCRCDRV